MLDGVGEEENLVATGGAADHLAVVYRTDDQVIMMMIWCLWWWRLWWLWRWWRQQWWWKERGSDGCEECCCAGICALLGRVNSAYVPRPARPRPIMTMMMHTMYPSRLDLVQWWWWWSIPITLYPGYTLSNDYDSYYVVRYVPPCKDADPWMICCWVECLFILYVCGGFYPQKWSCEVGWCPHPHFMTKSKKCFLETLTGAFSILMMMMTQV